jgi:hypothetical protein
MQREAILLSLKLIKMGYINFLQQFEAATPVKQKDRLLYSVWNYDVWEGPEGPEVNDRYKVGEIEINKDDKKEGILRELKTAEFLKKSAKYSLLTEEWSETLIHYEYCGVPSFQLELIEEKQVPTIKTNHHWREIMTVGEAGEKWIKEYDFLNEPENEQGFFYGNWFYLLAECVTTELKEWDGILSTSAFSAIVVKISEDRNGVKVGYLTC